MHSNLEPVYISGGEDDMEILVIQGKIGNYNCRFINAYGPQEYAILEDKIAFYARLDQEVKKCKTIQLHGMFGNGRKCQGWHRYNKK